jgi:hypothetical protein
VVGLERVKEEEHRWQRPRQRRHLPQIESRLDCISLRFLSMSPLKMLESNRVYRDHHRELVPISTTLE